jgi:hypothetical protein
MTAAVTETALEGLELVQRGKVRDIYAVGDDMLIVATDRLSAYDVVLSPGIPEKGHVLTTLSVWWFQQLADVVPNHLITAEVDEMPEAVRRHADVLRGRTMLVRRLEMLPDVATAEMEMLKLFGDELTDREELAADARAILEGIGAVTLRARLNEIAPAQPIEVTT